MPTRSSALILLLIVVTLSAGCSSATGSAVSPSSAGAMGMGGGDVPTVSDVRGVVCAPGRVAISTDITSDARGVHVAQVVAPADGWLVVRAAVPPGAVLGRQWVRSGENRDVTVRITAAEAPSAVLSLHVDRGRERGFDFDPALGTRNRDVAVYAGGAPVQRTVSLKAFGAVVEPNSALMGVNDQRAAGRVTVSYLLVPEDSWIAVHEVRDGMPGTRVGLAARPAGEWHEVDVSLSERPTTNDLIVMVHVDRGMPGQFEYRDTNPLSGADQPYLSAGVVLSEQIRVRR